MSGKKSSILEKARIIASALKNEPDRKRLTVVLRELISLAHRDRAIPRQYFTNFVYRTDAGPVSGYVNTRDRKHILDRLGERDADLDEKLRFYARADSAGLPTPRLLATIYPDRIEIGNEVQPATEPGAITAALDRARNLASNGSIFVKPNDGKSGQGCRRIGPDTPQEMLHEAAIGLHGGTFLVQETIVQHPDVARVSPNATGCLRVHTFTGNGEPEILSLLMRFVHGSAVTDTPSQGAMFAPVDEASGRVLPPALVHIQHGARKFDRHPETGTSFDIALPYWSKLLEVADGAARTFDNPFIGWDIAFASDGPILVEGNNRADLMLAQSAARGLLNHPKLGPVFEQALRGS